jgi:tripartite-type tricarboxylate transporter receptor subunit TctC
VARRTPPAAAERLGEALNRAIAEPSFRALIEPLGLAPEPPRDAAEVERYLAEDRARWEAVVRASSITID